MSSPSLPPLPEPAFIVDRGESFKVFTADQMRAYGEACAAAAADEIKRLRAECEALRVERDLHVRLYEARLREFNAAMGKTPT